MTTKMERRSKKTSDKWFFDLTNGNENDDAVLAPMEMKEKQQVSSKTLEPKWARNAMN